MIVPIETPLGGVVRLGPSVNPELKDGFMLVLTMRDEADTRHAEIFLSPENMRELADQLLILAGRNEEVEVEQPLTFAVPPCSVAVVTADTMTVFTPHEYRMPTLAEVPMARETIRGMLKGALATIEEEK